MIAFHPAAAEEMRRAAARYEDEQPGLGARFLDDLDARLDDLTAFPSLGAHWTHTALPRGEEVRRLPLTHFPYLVVYTNPAEAEIRILAVAHGRQRPGYWSERL